MIQTKLMYDPSVLEEDFHKDLEYFHEYMVKRGAAANTISSYMTSARHFHRLWGQMTMDHLLAYKEWLLANYRPSTVNSRIYGINQYAAALADRDSAAPRPPLHLSSIRQQQKPFLDNVISRRDYERLKRRLKKDGNLFWYFTVRMLGATGARVSELIQIKAEHIRIGYMDLCSKGGKVRRIYFPERLCMELSAWLLQRGVETGFIFTNRQGQPMTPRGISIHLKSWQSNTTSRLLPCIPIASATGLPKISFPNAMIFPCWPILWDMTALKPLGSISPVPLRSKGNSLTGL